MNQKIHWCLSLPLMLLSLAIHAVGMKPIDRSLAYDGPYIAESVSVADLIYKESTPQFVFSHHFSATGIGGGGILAMIIQ